MKELLVRLTSRLKHGVQRNRHDPRALLSKSIRFITNTLKYNVNAVFLYLILQAVSPVKKIVFCGMIFGRIGHLAGNTEIFIRRLRSGAFDSKCLYVGCNVHAMDVANKQMLTMIERAIPVIENKFLGNVINTPLIKKSKFYMDMEFYSNEYYEFNSLPPSLSFTAQEEERGWHVLKDMGIGEKDWFVCFHSRDRKYLDAAFKGGEWSYHDYRDCTIENYLKAMEYITSQGGFALRMGKVVDKPLAGITNPRIIDYASTCRSDFMDIYLSAKCKFFVASSAGLHLVPAIFSVPIAGTNFTHLEIPPYRKGDIFLPKKIFSLTENRFLTFAEIFARGIGMWLTTRQFDEAGLEVIENSPQEILELVTQMYESLEGRFQYTAEDRELLGSYRSLIESRHRCYNGPAEIGIHFLRENRGLLDR